MEWLSVPCRYREAQEGTGQQRAPALVPHSLSKSPSSVPSCGNFSSTSLGFPIHEWGNENDIARLW